MLLSTEDKFWRLCHLANVPPCEHHNPESPACFTLDDVAWPESSWRTGQGSCDKARCCAFWAGTAERSAKPVLLSSEAIPTLALACQKARCCSRSTYLLFATFFIGFWSLSCPWELGSQCPVSQSHFYQTLTSWTLATPAHTDCETLNLTFDADIKSASELALKVTEVYTGTSFHFIFYYLAFSHLISEYIYFLTLIKIF